MEQYQFSIVIPVYNVEQYLERCLQSVIGQKTESLEAILVDDGSKDASGAICDRYAEKYSWMKVIHKENGGLSSARNRGMEAAQGEYIFFLDSDDYIESDMCEKISCYLKDYPEAEVISMDGWEDNGSCKAHMRRLPRKELCCRKGTDYLVARYRENNMNVEACLYVFRRTFLVQHGFRFVEGILHEDVEFTPRVLLKTQQILEVPDAFYHYIVRENSISTQKNRTRNIQDLFETLEKQSELAGRQDADLEKWMKNAVLNSYLNMVYDARMYRKEYRGLLKKRFLFGKAATLWNHFRVLICLLNVRMYCWMNDCYKKLRRT